MLKNLSHYLLFICIYNLYTICCISQIAYNIDLVSHSRIPENASSIWGYTDSKGKEYALLGTAQGLRIYALENPAIPEELHFIPCTPSPWRELKTSGSHAYVVTEAEDGLLIVDLSQLPDSVHYEFKKNFTNLNGDSLQIIAAHTLFVDEKNFIYLSGARPNGYGFIILDPGSDPFNPVVLYQNNDQYIHEVFVYRDTLYAAELFHGVFSIWEMNDRTNPRRIAEQVTGGRFTHSVWLEKERAVLYTADEISGARVEAWNLSNINAIRLLDQFQVKNDKTPFIIPHNVFHHNDRLYVSYYTEGMRILDTRDPNNVIEVAYYDTHTQYDQGFHGCWSVYPYFDSGLCIASDIENGLFVLKYNGNQAAYLEADIVDKSTSDPVFNASVKIQQSSYNVEEFSNLKGKVKSGAPEAGSATIEVYKKGYYPQTRDVVFDKKNDLVLKFDLEELPKHNVKVIVKDKLTQEFIQDAHIILYNNDYSFKYKTDVSGESVANGLYEHMWTLVAGKWGFKQVALKDFILNSDQVIEIELERGYEDDFILDLGWTSSGKDPKVEWILGDFTEIPIPSSNFPSNDIPADLGNACYYTNNFDNNGIEYHLHGELSLISPPMDLSNYSSVDISYYAWAYVGYTSKKEIFLISVDTSILLEVVPEVLTGNFNPHSNIHVDLSRIKKDSVHFVFRLYNDSATANMAIQLMGAIDVFRISGEEIVSTKDFTLVPHAYPNPVREKLCIHDAQESDFMEYEVYSVFGQYLSTALKHKANTTCLDVSELKNGIYFLKSKNSKNIIRFIKI
jgi:choice-of-anchor B domain-containing protein